MSILLQSKLNCEVLYEEQAFEVRWAVAGDSIVLQLVSKIGEWQLQSILNIGIKLVNLKLKYLPNI